MSVVASRSRAARPPSTTADSAHRAAMNSSAAATPVTTGPAPAATDTPSQATATAPAATAYGAQPPVGQDRRADHLPPGGAEGEGGLLVGGRRLPEDLPRERRDDRQHHDGEHDRAEQHRLAVRAVATEERQPARVGVQPRRQVG